MMNAQQQILRYDAAGAMLPQTGLSVQDLQELEPRLAAARQTVAETDVQQFENPGHDPYR